MKKPNPNLWCVDIVLRTGTVLVSAYVLASSPEVASRKAARWAKTQGYKATRIGGIKHEGTIDVF